MIFDFAMESHSFGSQTRGPLDLGYIPMRNVFEPRLIASSLTNQDPPPPIIIDEDGSRGYYQ